MNLDGRVMCQNISVQGLKFKSMVSDEHWGMTLNFDRFDSYSIIIVLKFISSQYCTVSRIVFIFVTLQ